MKSSFVKSLSRRCAIAVAIGCLALSAVAADNFPSRPVRILMPAAPGGGIDIIARLVAVKMAEKLGQPVIIDSRPGADTLVATRLAKEAPADGYTMLAQANGFTILPELKIDAGYDPLKDFTGIGHMSRAPFIMEVAAEEPSKTVADFVLRAKATNLTYASGGIGGPPHMAALMFLRSQNLELTNVQYKGNGAALPDVAANRVSMIFDTYNSSLPFYQSGKIRPIAVTGSSRIAPLPNTPTFKEAGFDYNYELWMGLVTRAGTPKDAVQKLSDALRYALDSKDLKDRLIGEGFDPSFITPDEFNTRLTKEVVEMKKLVSDLKLPKQ